MAYTLTTRENVIFPQVFANAQFNGVSWVPLAGINNSINMTFSKVRSGSNVPGYKELIRKGNSAGSAYTLEATTVEKVQLGSASLIMEDFILHPKPSKWMVGGRLIFNGLAKSPASVSMAHLSTSQSKAEAMALSKAYKSIRSEYQHLNASAAVAELGDVLRQFGRPFKEIVNLTDKRLVLLSREMQRMKSGRINNRVAWARIVSSTYLEYAFGLVPLIQDTKGIAEAVARWESEKLDNPKLRSRIKARGLDSTKTEDVLVSAAPTWQVILNHQTIKSTETRAQYIVGLKATPEANFGSNKRLMSLLGFDPKNWQPTVYEVVPWSWLLDYFTNVGEIIEAGATCTTNVSWITKTITNRTRVQVSSVYNGQRTKELNGLERRWYGNADAGFGSYELVRTTLTRTIPPSLGVPPFVVEHPFGNVRKMANMVAVLFSKRIASSL